MLRYPRLAEWFRFINSFRQLRIRCRRFVAAQRLECSAQLTNQEFRLFPRSEVPAFGQLIIIDEFGIRLLRPAPWGWIEFVREDAHSGRDRDAFDGEERRPFVLPIETGP